MYVGVPVSAVCHSFCSRSEYAHKLFRFFPFNVIYQPLPLTFAAVSTQRSSLFPRCSRVHVELKHVCWILCMHTSCPPIAFKIKLPSNRWITIIVTLNFHDPPVVKSANNVRGVCARSLIGAVISIIIFFTIPVRKKFSKLFVSLVRSSIRSNHTAQLLIIHTIARIIFHFRQILKTFFRVTEEKGGMTSILLSKFKFSNELIPNLLQKSHASIIKWHDDLLGIHRRRCVEEWHMIWSSTMHSNPSLLPL